MPDNAEASGNSLMGLLSLDESDSTMLGRMNKIATGYVLAKGFSSVGKAWYAKAKDAMTFRISVYGDDLLYDDLHAFILENTPAKQQKSLVARSIEGARTNRSSGMVESMADGESNGNPSPLAQGSHVRLAYKGEREQTVTIDGNRIKVRIDVPEIKGDPDKWIRYTKQMERIIFIASSVAGRDAIHNMLKGMLEDRSNIPHQSVVRIADKWQSWSTRSDLPSRPMDTVILREGQAEALVGDMTKFLQDEGEYNRRSMPWHRGYLFHGPPGTGKTSVAWALAHHFGMDLWYMPLADIEKDQDLIQLVSSVKPRSMLLLEDVDVFHAAKARDDDNGVSLSGLLNSLDGIATPHGLITVLTTNDISVLDDALIRPGRVDRTEEIGLLDENQAVRLLQLFYPNVKESAARRVGRRCVDRTPASVLEVCKRNMEDSERALKELLK